MTRSLTLVLVAVVVLATGCNDGNAAGEAEQVDQPTPTPVEELTPSPEPTGAPTPTPPQAEPPPELQLIGDDYEQVVRSHTAFRNWLFRNPDPDLVDEIAHPDCECYLEKELLASYVEGGLRWTGEGPGIVVHDVSVVDDQARNLVHLQVVFERPEGGELVDAEGTVHNSVEPREPWLEDVIFVREDPQSPWLLRDFTDRGPVEEASNG